MNEELRERCIEAITADEAFRKSVSREAPSTLSVARAALDALLAVEGTCPTCGGTGRYSRLVLMDDGQTTVHHPCLTCGGSGSDGTPALVGMLMEQVGWFKENGQKIRTFRLRPDTEGGEMTDERETLHNLQVAYSELVYDNQRQRDRADAWKDEVARLHVELEAKEQTIVALNGQLNRWQHVIETPRVRPDTEGEQ